MLLAREKTGNKKADPEVGFFLLRNSEITSSRRERQQLQRGQQRREQQRLQRAWQRQQREQQLQRGQQRERPERRELQQREPERRRRVLLSCRKRKRPGQPEQQRGESASLFIPYQLVCDPNNPEADQPGGANQGGIIAVNSAGYSLQGPFLYAWHVTDCHRPREVWATALHPSARMDSKRLA